VKSDLTDFQGLFLRACKEQALEEAAKRASEEGTFFQVERKLCPGSRSELEEDGPYRN
jgi:hypothetical protein